MKQDIILAGVGGQGILSIAFVIDKAALKEGLQIKQAEVHGMSQRGGAVQSHLRLSRGPIWSDLVPKGRADLLLSVEPLESLRYLEYLDPAGLLVTSATPYVNIPDYPPLEGVLAELRKSGNTVVVDSEALAKAAGSTKAQNMVMLGAASNRLMLETANLEEVIRKLFEPRGEALVALNLKAFVLGREAGRAAA
jgi:indolepyruvate ferredoxin oxidoreductase beta subunit